MTWISSIHSLTTKNQFFLSMKAFADPSEDIRGGGSGDLEQQIEMTISKLMRRCEIPTKLNSFEMRSPVPLVSRFSLFHCVLALPHASVGVPIHLLVFKILIQWFERITQFRFLSSRTSRNSKARFCSKAIFRIRLEACHK